MIRTDALTLRQLRALAAVARGGSLAAAAGGLGLTPPAIHAQIRALEGILGVALLQRRSDSAGSSPTPEGEMAMEAGRRIEEILRRLAADLEARAQGKTGRVVLGAVSTGKYFAPRLVARLREILPEIEVVLRESNRERVLEGLERQELDLAIMGRPPDGPEIEEDVLGPHPHGLIAAPENPLTRLEEVGAKDLLRHSIISREQGSGTRLLMTRYLDSLADGRGFTLIEMGSNESIKQAAMAGLGVAFLSLHTAMEELRQGRLALVRAPGLPLVRQWRLARARAAPLGPATARIRAEILAMKGDFLPK
ncbi:LysR substrate-binding domain-containing protein [Neomegalonema sp.]|uniref:LysR substrate-binding domain-containing protein n=1 Tax=Neomegalonema sp. TaxID=2039713 RepID=UPI0026108275|nr:LysR substrate-binding domain-containing protein [Neomegalonema sp.]MDD2868705.1 LysR substrate-binding domain-containing protein [Neomegalonema sp.]